MIWWEKIKNRLAPSVYLMIGGKKKIRKIVDDFYFVMDTDEKARDCRNLHREDLKEASDKLFDFLCGWLGGPDQYVQKYGHPRMRMRHLPFVIGKNEKEQWLYCMNIALEKNIKSHKRRNRIFEAMKGLAERIQNA